MGSTGAGTGRGSAGGRGSNLRPMTAQERRNFRAATGRSAPRGAMTNDALQAGGRAPSGSRATRVNAREFQRATGVNPRTGERRRRRGQ